MNQGAVAVSPHARISGVPRLSDLRAGKRSSEPFKADTGDSGGRARGDAARSMLSGRYTSELKRLSAVIQWISRVFSRVENQAGERQCVKRPAGFTANGRADRISSRFDRICSFFRAYRLEEGSVSSTRIIAESVCQPYARFRKTGGFFACLRAFPVCQVYTQKINISATKGVVFVSGEPWVGSP